MHDKERERGGERFVQVGCGHLIAVIAEILTCRKIKTSSVLGWLVCSRT